MPPRRAIWVLVGLAILLGAAFPYFARVMNANERPRLLQGIAWVQTGESAIDGPATEGIKPGIDVARGTNGRLYPNKPPGATVPAAVAYAVLPGEPALRTYTFAARMLGAWLPTLVLCAFAWRKLQPRFGPDAATFAVVAYALATPVMSYARLLFGHQLAACLLFVGVVWTVEALDDLDPRKAALGGALAASAVVVEYFVAFAGLPLAVLLAFRLRDPSARRTGVAAIAGALAPIVVLGAYQAAVFGSVFSTPYHHVVREEFAAAHGTGLLGLSAPTGTSIFEHLLSPWGGLLFWAPLTVLAAASLVQTVRAGEATTFDRVGLATFCLLAALCLGLTQTGGWRVGPRYLMSALPLLLPGFALLFRWVAARPYVLAVGAASVLLNALAATLFPHLIPEGNPVRDQLWPVIAEGLEPYNPLQALGLWGVAVPLGLVAAVGVFVWALQPNRKELGLGLLGATALFALVTRVPPAKDADVSATAIIGAWEPKQT